jgi:hypothetical protein
LLSISVQGGQPIQWNILSRFSKPKLAHTNYLTSNNIGKSVKLMQPMSRHLCNSRQREEKQNNLKLHITPKCCWWRKAKSPPYKHAIAGCQHGGHQDSFKNCLWLLLKIRQCTVTPPFNNTATNCLHYTIHYIKRLHGYI